MTPTHPHTPDAPDTSTATATGGANRSHLIHQLIQVFEARGYEGATLTQLASATGLGKASLYHHFPGGKAEIADVLVRHAVGELQRHAFSRLDGPGDPAARIQAMIAGVAEYLSPWIEHGEGHCVLAVLAQGSAHDTQGERIAAQFADWQAAIARVYEQAGAKPKRAARAAAELLDRIYGALLVSKLLNDPKHFKRGLKRLANGVDDGLLKS